MTQPRGSYPQEPERDPRPRRDRRPKRRHKWFWWPGRNRGTSFLDELPRHSETAILHLKDPTKKRKRRIVRRTIFAFLNRWRMFLTSLTVLFVLSGGTALTMTGVRDVGLDPNKAPVQTAPTLEALNRSIELGERYVNALYKPLPGGLGVQSEASGVPFKAYFPNSKTWVLMGEEKEVCPAGNCEASTSVDPIETGYMDEKYKITFNTADTNEALRVGISIKWDAQVSRFQITLGPEKVSEPVELWLDTAKLASYSPTSKAASTHTFDNAKQSQMRMLRFTIRHATQAAFMYWLTYGKDQKKAEALSRFLEQNKYAPGYDMRAPIFDLNQALPDDLPANLRAYPDCDHLAASSSLAYAYRSKVCLFPEAYIALGERDSFLQAWQALTTLEKYGDPNRELPGINWWLQGGTPLEVAHHLQGQWNRNGYGIPKCNPFACAESSSIRTSAFGALQTELGYGYGNAQSKQFADAAAAMIVNTQIGPDGKFIMEAGTFYRPSQVGAYLAAWDSSSPRFVVPSTPQLVNAMAFAVTRSKPIPPEYLGLVPSNSETSFDALAFLQRYRCAKHKVGCLQ